MVSPSDALSDELVSHGELMSSLLFTEVLRERQAEAGWFDARSVMRTNANFGCAEPELGTLHHQVETHLRPRLEQAIMVTQDLSGEMPQDTPQRLDAAVVITRLRFSVRHFTPHALTSGPTSQGSTPRPTHCTEGQTNRPYLIFRGQRYGRLRCEGPPPGYATPGNA
ncbi:aspartate kinase III [Citrobacter freundii]|nr:aspartate kinase III [Citrobacter freundii]